MGIVSAYIFDRNDLGNVDIDDLEAILDSPVHVPLGNISLQAQSQRIDSARL
jgi:hypothetical protein